MKTLGKKLGNRLEHKLLGRKLMSGNVFGRKLTQHNSQPHHLNHKESEHKSDLEKVEYRPNRDYINGIDIHKTMPENMLTNITHCGKPTREAHQRRNFY